MGGSYIFIKVRQSYMIKSLESVIDRIIEYHFHESPVNITRFTSGICNEVFSVKLSKQEVVVRLNRDDTQMRGSETYIPLFKAHGITVPTILYSDYTKRLVPYSYQITTRLPGQDINQVIAELSHDELSAIANEVANIFQTLAPLPTYGKFGYVYGDKTTLYDSWTPVVQHMANLICEQGE